MGPYMDKYVSQISDCQPICLAFRFFFKKVTLMHRFIRYLKQCPSPCRTSPEKLFSGASKKNVGKWRSTSHTRENTPQLYAAMHRILACPCVHVHGQKNGGEVRQSSENLRGGFRSSGHCGVKCKPMEEECKQKGKCKK